MRISLKVFINLNKNSIRNISNINKNRIRKPIKGDKIKLKNNNLEELNGLKKNEIGVIISIDKNDPNMFYQIRLPSSYYLAWFNKNDIELYNPNDPIPKPQPPESNECCGSECPDCVWIKYWEELQEWEKEYPH